MSAPMKKEEDGTELLVLARALLSETRRAERRGVRRLAPAEPAAPEPAAPEPAAPATATPTPAVPPPAPPRPAPRSDRPAPATSPATSPGPSVGASENARGPAEVATTALAASCGDLTALRQVVSECRACGLCEARTQTVFADGTGPARVMFVGEAPGFHEDQKGVPFVGQAGGLLTDIIQKGMGLERSEVYIANVLKCRPPENRDPSAEEKALCTPFLDRQIELVDPEVLIPLGRHAACHVLGVDAAMSRLRGRVHDLRGRKVVPTYHPAYLLRNPSAKRDCWQDIQLALAELGLRPPGR